jgi:hypothetical protein
MCLLKKVKNKYCKLIIIVISRYKYFLIIALRMYPIAININRRCVKQTNINGFDIPRDLIILVVVLNIHNDLDVWGTTMEILTKKIFKRI